MKQNRPTPGSVRHPGTLPAPEGGRHMSSMDRDAITRALTAQVCRAGLSGADLRVWLAVVDRTLTWRWLSDSVDHTVLRNTAAVTRPGRGLAALAEAGLLHYWPGISRNGKTTKSAYIVLVPARWQRYRRDGIVWWDDEEPEAEAEESAQEAEPGRPYGPDEPHLTDAMDEMSHRGMDDSVHTYGSDGPHPMDESVHRGMDKAVHLNHETTTTREDHEGGGHEERNHEGAGAAGADGSPAPTAGHGVVLFDPSEQAASDQAPEWDGSLDSLTDWLEDVSPTPPGWDQPPVERRIGTATGVQAVEKFASESGLALSARTQTMLAASLDEVAAKASPNELLLGLGYWHEYRGGKWPEDAAERVEQAMVAAPDHLLMDSVNAMSPGDAIREGRCRAQMALLPRHEREALEADTWSRLTGHGLDWPHPTTVHGLLPTERIDVAESTASAATHEALDRIGWGTSAARAAAERAWAAEVA